MTQFKVGEKVAFYSSGCRVIGTIDTVYEVGGLRVKVGPEYFSAHPKQCRRLKSKVKAREFWLQLGGWSSTTQQAGYATITPSVIIQTQPSDPEKWIHVREVRRKK